MKENIILIALKGVTEPFLSWIPIIFWWISTFFPTNLYISELGVRLSMGTFYAIVSGLAIFWVLVSPFKAACKTYSQHLARNLLPVEIVLLIFIAQWHFTLSLILTLLTLAVLVFWTVFINKTLADKKAKTRRIVFRRISVQTSSFILSVALFIGLFYMITEKSLVNFSAEASSIDYISGYDVCHDTAWMFEIFDDWEMKSLEDRANALQHLLNLETAYLNIEPLKLKIVSLENYTLGSFRFDKDNVYINITHLQNSNLEDCINTIAHEAFHAYQRSVINTLDFLDEFVQTSHFFRQARYWRYNFENYISSDVCFISYLQQPLEQDARAHAAIRTRYWTYRIHQHTAIQHEERTKVQ